MPLGEPPSLPLFLHNILISLIAFIIYRRIEWKDRVKGLSVKGIFRVVYSVETPFFQQQYVCLKFSQIYKSSNEYIKAYPHQ
jgi:hypothetical protein